MKRTTRMWSIVLTGLLVAANFVVANLWMKKVDWRWDLTEDQRYEIGEGSQNILERLDDTVNIKCYYSSDVPSRYSHVADILVEKLDEYQALSKDKVIYSFVDPNTDDVAKQECDDMRISPARIQDYEDVNTQRMITCYMAVVFRYGDKKVILNLFKDTLQSLDDPTKFTADLEYFLTKSIRNVSTDRKTVGLLADVQMVPANPRDPKGEKRRYQGVQMLQGAIGRTHDVVVLDPVDLSRGNTISGDIDVLVVYKPKNINDVGLYAIDQFIMHGGDVLFFLDNGAVDFVPTPKKAQYGNVQIQDYDLPGYKGTPIEHILGSFVEHYGVRVEDSFVEDRSGATVIYYTSKEMVRNFMGQPVVNLANETNAYYSWPLVPARDKDGRVLDPNEISTDFSIMSSNDTIAFTWVSPLTISEDNLKRHDGNVNVLIKSGPESWARPIKDEFFSPQKEKQDLLSERKRSDLAMIVSGKFESFFKGKDIPAPMGTSGAAIPSLEDLAKSRRDSAAEEGTLVIVGDADFIGDATLQMLAQFDMKEKGINNPRDPRLYQKAQSALLFASNAVDILCFGEEASDLFTLQKRVVKSREIKKLDEDDPEMGRLKLINFAAIPLIVVLFGFLRFLFRKTTTRASA